MSFSILAAASGSYIDVNLQSTSERTVKVNICSVKIKKHGSSEFVTAPYAILIGDRSPNFTMELDAFELRSYRLAIEGLKRCEPYTYNIDAIDADGNMDSVEGQVGDLAMMTTLDARKAAREEADDEMVTNVAATVSALSVGAIYRLSCPEKSKHPDSADDSSEGGFVGYSRVWCDREGLRLEFGRLTSKEADALLLQRTDAISISAKVYGDKCPSCCSLFAVIKSSNRNDDWINIMSDFCVCTKEGCGVTRICEYSGYGRV
jgi:hypothetical protein